MPNRRGFPQWTHLAWTIIGFFHIYIAFNRRPREAHLVQDMVVAVIYIGVALSIIRFVFDAPVGTLVATSGVVAVIIGLALQNILADVFSGIALNASFEERMVGVRSFILNGGNLARRIELMTVHPHMRISFFE